jgi:hypothetical protein
MSATPTAPAAPNAFDWPLAYEAERLIGGCVEAFLLRNTFARKLAERMRDETGTDFFEWVDHLVLARAHVGALHAAGFVEEKAGAYEGTKVYWHPRAMMPRVLLREGAGRDAVPPALAIKPEVLADFLAAHDLDAAIEGAWGARFRRALVSEENGTKFFAIERLGARGFVVREPEAKFVNGALRARELWRTRKRDSRKAMRTACSMRRPGSTRCSRSWTATRPANCFSRRSACFGRRATARRASRSAGRTGSGSAGAITTITRFAARGRISRT